MNEIGGGEFQTKKGGNISYILGGDFLSEPTSVINGGIFNTITPPLPDGTWEGRRFYTQSQFSARPRDNSRYPYDSPYHSLYSILPPRQPQYRWKHWFLRRYYIEVDNDEIQDIQAIRFFNGNVMPTFGLIPSYEDLQNLYVNYPITPPTQPYTVELFGEVWRSFGDFTSSNFTNLPIGHLGQHYWTKDFDGTIRTDADGLFLVFDETTIFGGSSSWGQQGIRFT